MVSSINNNFRSTGHGQSPRHRVQSWLIFADIPQYEVWVVSLYLIHPERSTKYKVQSTKCFYYREVGTVQ